MKPYQTKKDSEHLPASEFLFGRIIVFGVAPSSLDNKQKGTRSCLILTEKCAYFICLASSFDKKYDQVCIGKSSRYFILLP